MAFFDNLQNVAELSAEAGQNEVKRLVRKWEPLRVSGFGLYACQQGLRRTDSREVQHVNMDHFLLLVCRRKQSCCTSAVAASDIQNSACRWYFLNQFVKQPGQKSFLIPLIIGNSQRALVK